MLLKLVIYLVDRLRSDSFCLINQYADINLVAEVIKMMFMVRELLLEVVNMGLNVSDNLIFITQTST